jgi:cytochrome c553
LLTSRTEAQDAGSGAALYTERCATCHGADAKGQNGPNLTTLWASGASDDRVLQTIRRGVPGSVMPPSDAPDEEIRAIVAHLKSLAAPAPADNARANAERPQVVVLVTRDGRRIRGERKNEDAFSIQILDTGGRLQGYLKGDLREIVRGDGRSSVREMAHLWTPSNLTAQLVNGQPQASETGYGFGLRVTSDCRFEQIVAHGGGLPGFGSYMAWLPDYGVGMCSTRRTLSRFLTRS